MSFLFAPAVALLDRLRFRWKFVLFGVISAGTVAYLLTALVLALRTDIHFIDDELNGLRVVAPLLKVIETLQTRRDLATSAANDADPVDSLVIQRLPAATQAMEQAWADAERALRHLADTSDDDIRWEEHWGEAARMLEMLGGPSSGSAPQWVFDGHTGVIDNVVRVMHDVAEDSRLALDPQAASYYLIALVTQTVPDITERIGRLRGQGASILASHYLSYDQRLRVSLQLGELDHAMLGAEDMLDRAAQANAVRGSELNGLRTELAAVVVAMRGLVIDILDERFELTPTEFSDASAHALEVAFQQSTQTIVPAIEALLLERRAGYVATFNLVVAFSALATALLAYFLIALYIAVARSVNELGAGAERLGQGDLSSRIRLASQDELSHVAERFNGMAQSIAEVLHRVQRSADEVSRAAVAMSASAGQVSRSSAHQSEAASSMAAAVEEMTVGIDEIGRHAGEAESISTRSGEISENGAQVVQQTAAEMELIAREVDATASTIEALGQKSEEISSIVNVIREIADQTNLLALNAAIEAARAGETGRGFAVVADEVRKLAERTSNATQEISGMVQAIQHGTDEAVQSMNRGVTRVREGVELTQRAGSAMDEIRSGAQSVVGSVSDISMALREQSAASNDIARNVEQIAQMAEENNAAVGETASTATRLEQLADGLRKEVGHFRL
ncbi:methyl-accepting chemotaxis protein [Pseudothauera nasutitermitis]|uniref:Methyl-accepting chemotaxis protein n=1 Tax=Pseudothauera nasutitermitis TaxID=2565930 RepID=A0A4S4B371_9RHOO|nr:methyl-accepting chemotaxis protein [Pseudothauera nasutitermitis]THF67098.1 methyl-accepting chemotaxis protein [Pseudothauera nasutitermitis]